MKFFSKRIRFAALWAMVLLLSSCFSIERNGKEFGRLAPGSWRGVFTLDDGEKVPVNFTVNPEDPTRWTFIDGKGQTVPDSLRFVVDTIYCRFKDSYLKLVYEYNLMEGYLYPTNRGHYPVKFLAQNGAYPRFPDYHPADLPAGMDGLSGTWTLRLQDEQSQPGDTASVQARLQIDVPETGSSALDARLQADLPGGERVEMELRGIVQKNKVYFSGFNGTYVTFLSAAVLDGDAMGNGSLRFQQRRYYCDAVKQK